MGDSLVTGRLALANTGVRGQVVFRRLDCVTAGAVVDIRLSDLNRSQLQYRATANRRRVAHVMVEGPACG